MSRLQSTPNETARQVGHNAQSSPCRLRQLFCLWQFSGLGLLQLATGNAGQWSWRLVGFVCKLVRVSLQKTITICIQTSRVKHDTSHGMVYTHATVEVQTSGHGYFHSKIKKLPFVYFQSASKIRIKPCAWINLGAEQILGNVLYKNTQINWITPDQTFLL